MTDLKELKRQLTALHRWFDLAVDQLGTIISNIDVGDPEPPIKPVPVPVPIPTPDPPDPPAPPDPPVPVPDPPSPVPIPEPGATLEGDFVELRNHDTTAYINVPRKFAHTFIRGHVPNGKAVIGEIDGELVPVQCDIKNRYADGSARHVLMAFILPAIEPNETQRMAFRLIDDVPATNPVQIQSTAENLTFTADGYSVLINDGIAAGPDRVWRSGNICREEHYWMPIGHNRLRIRFDLCDFGYYGRCIDVVVENTNAMDGGGVSADGITYRYQIGADSGTVNHAAHTRWRKTYWFGTEANVSVVPNCRYLTQTGAVPQYGGSFLDDVDFEDHIDGMLNSYRSNNGLMQSGCANPYMPNGGGRPELGLLPSWDVLYLLTEGDQRTEELVLGMAEVGNYWSAFFRDNSGSDEPISVIDHPQVTTHSNTWDRAENPLGPRPTVSNPNTVDGSHRPAYGYLAYLLTGDYYHLETVLFYTSWMTLRTAAVNRDYEKGLFKFEQTRGQCYQIRTAAQAAWIVPDDHPLAHYPAYLLDNNMAWYENAYIAGDDANRANALGWVRNGDDVGSTRRKFVQPWQQYMFTTALNYARNMGLSVVEPFLNWHIQFVMTLQDDPGYCYQFATVYHMEVYDTPTQHFDDFAQCFTATIDEYYGGESGAIYAAACGSPEMTAAADEIEVDGGFVGYPRSPTGYPALMGGALAAAVELVLPNAQQYYDRAMNTQPIKWWKGVNFAIGPRG